MTEYPPDSEDPVVRRLTTARIPTRDGEFQLALYENSEDDKDHLALIHGDISSESSVLVRVHSECFTGDVLGSLRCDCGEQLNVSMRMIADHGSGILLYLRQEGRGIGLQSKLEAYNLQDEGYDTVDANLALGHGADERDYTIGALILQDLDVSSVRLITNNPEKIEALQDLEIEVAERVPLQPHINRHNSEYLRTKVNRMRHMLELSPMSAPQTRTQADDRALRERFDDHYRATGRPFVTLSYVQSLDGSIATQEGRRLTITDGEALAYTHQLRTAHDAVLVGIGAFIDDDDPALTASRSEGSHPRPVVLDTQLRTPLTANIFRDSEPPPLIATNERPSTERQQALEAKGADVLRLPCRGEDGLALDELLNQLGQRGLRSVLVEGGARVIRSFMRERLVDHVVLMMAPEFFGGMQAFEKEAVPAGTDAKESPSSDPYPRLTHISQQWVGEDLVLRGDPVWEK